MVYADYVTLSGKNINITNTAIVRKLIIEKVYVLVPSRLQANINVYR